MEPKRGEPKRQSSSRSGNRGRAAENAVFIELKRRVEAARNMEIYYWKNGRHQEVEGC